MPPRPGPAALALVVVAALAACTAGGGIPRASGPTGAPPSGADATASPAAPTATPGATATPETAAWLRAWLTQAIPPRDALARADTLVVTADGVAVQPMAVPAVFPGPAVTPLGGRRLSAAGRQAILARARELGLLGGIGDLGSPTAPGAAVGHIVLQAGGRRVEIAGDPVAEMVCIKAPCNSAPRSREAFGTFWRALSDLGWLGAELGPERPFSPPAYAVLVGPSPMPDPSLGADVALWPLAVPITSFGSPVGGARCGTVAGRDAELLRAALGRANALTQWAQGPATNATFGLTVRPVADGSDACREVFGAG